MHVGGVQNTNASRHRYSFCAAARTQQPTAFVVPRPCTTQCCLFSYMDSETRAASPQPHHEINEVSQR
eukprot:6017168-Pleurochrysis_carterae.AAC.1